MNGSRPTTAIPAYRLGDASLPASPITPTDLKLLERTLLFGEEDRELLRLSGEILRDQVEDVLDVWYGFVGSNPHLVEAFFKRGTNEPIGEYLAAVRKRFARWIIDTANARFDEPWLRWQEEIGRRHHRSGKNSADGFPGADHVKFRYLLALTYPITATLTPFLAAKGHSTEQVARMRDAWVKAVLLQVILWSRPYVKDGDF